LITFKSSNEWLWIGWLTVIYLAGYIMDTYMAIIHVKIIIDLKIVTRFD
jgi:hypothetical protein